MEEKPKKQKKILFMIIGAGLIITVLCIAGYYLWQYQAGEAIRQEGEKYAQEYIARYVIRCGDNIYISGENVTLFRGSITPIPNLMQVESVNATATASDEPLNADERRDGIEWKGRIFIINGKSRNYSFNGEKWGDWNDSPRTVDHLLGSSLYRIDGKWAQESLANFGKDMRRGIFDSYGVRPKPISCENIPK